MTKNAKAESSFALAGWPSPHTRLAIVVIGLVFVAGSSGQQEILAVEQPPFSMRHPVPDLPENLEWFNASGPLTWNDLRGKFVLLDFWTYCCINCMHVIPELKKLEAKYPRELVVIGIHSAKFQEERESQNIIQAMGRYGITHPVVNDREMLVWRRFGVDAWPTLVLIDPEGFVVWTESGETTFEVLDGILASAIPFYKQRGLLDLTPVHFPATSAIAATTPLRFPGKVFADAETQRLFIADSGHNRIVVCDFQGQVLHVIGEGREGLRDGAFDEARFASPQGMVLFQGRLLVADTENHAIREIDFEQELVRTVAGTGQQRRRPPLMQMTEPLKTELSSPWDLSLVNDWVYIAMAGCHQIWRMDANCTRIGPYAGNGREDIVDGPRLPPDPYTPGYASFAQPSGLATDGEWLYVADSEGSSIRAVSIGGRGAVRTIVGTAHLLAARLFTFGDRDGPAPQVLLQHPIGICFAQGSLYIADTYNNKIKRVNPRTGETTTVAGDGRPGNSEAPPRFDEPAGITSAGTALFVADTNNHAIRRLQLGAAPKVTTFAIEGLSPPGPAPQSVTSVFDGLELVALSPFAAKPDGNLQLRISLELPPGYKLNPNIPAQVTVRFKGEAVQDSVEKPFRVLPSNGALMLSLEQLPPSVTGLQIAVTYYWCETSDRGLCRMGTAGWDVDLTWTPLGKKVIDLTHTVRE